LATEKILLIQTSRLDLPTGDTTWLTLNKRLHQLGAKQIIYTFVPEGVSRNFYEHAKSIGAVCFGRNLTYDKYGNRQVSFKPIPKQAQGLDLAFGVNEIPAPTYGIYRLYDHYVHIKDRKFPTLVHVAADQRLKEPLPHEPFLVNLNGKPEQFPSISLQRSLSDNFIPELVRGRSILIGFANSEYQTGLQTPITPSSHGMSKLQYLGLALDTLLSKKNITQTGPWTQLACLLCIFLIGLIAYQLMSTSFALWFTVISLGAYALICWGLFSFLLIWPPVFEIIAAQFLLFLVLLRGKQMRDLEVMETIRTRLSNQLQKYILPEDFISTQQHWQHIVTMVNQTLNFTRSIFLEPVANDHRVKEIVANNCSFEDIAERRRDYERTPYTFALSENGPVRVENFLVRGEEQEIQFLVPLFFADQIMGFWAFGIHHSEYSAASNLEGVVNDYSQQMSEMLYQRQKLQEEKRIQNKPLVQLLQLKAGRSIQQEILEAYTVLEKKLLLFESLLDGLQTAIMVYDLFGRVAQINSAMEEILREMDLKPFELTASELATELSQADINESRIHINKAITQQNSKTLPVMKTTSSPKKYILHISAIKASRNNTSNTDSIQPFQTLGISFELVESTLLQDICTLKDDLMEDLREQQRTNLQNTVGYLHRLGNENTNREDLLRDFPELTEKLSILDDIDTLYTYIAQDLYTRNLEQYPIPYSKYLHQAVHSVSQEATARNIQVTINATRNSSLVLINPEILLKIFQAILAILLEDAAEETLINVTITQEDFFQVFEFTNQGFGIPDETFQKYLFSPQVKASDNFLNLKELLPYLDKIYAELKGSSQVGKGTMFSLKLRALH
jgi:hypothetical protein